MVVDGCIVTIKAEGLEIQKTYWFISYIKKKTQRDFQFS